MSEDAPQNLPPTVAVVGGGITGLAAAYRLVERAERDNHPVRVQLFEAGPRLGGSIQTEQRDGFLLEHGPDSFITQKPGGLDLCKRLGLSDRLIGTGQEFRKTFVVGRGKLHSLPEGFMLLAPSRFWPFVTSRLFSWPGKFRMALDLEADVVGTLRRNHRQDDVAVLVHARLVVRRALDDHERPGAPVAGRRDRGDGGNLRHVR